MKPGPRGTGRGPPAGEPAAGAQAAPPDGRPGGDPRRQGSRRGPPPDPTSALPLVPAAVLLVTLLVPLAAPAAGQLRRAPDVPYVPDGAGRLLVGVGGGHELDARFPLSGLRGDLSRLGSVTVAYSFAPGAVVQVRGDAARRLAVESRGPSAVPLDEGVDDGVTHDVGDFRISTLFRLLGEARGPSAGLHLEVKLPNSDEERGLGLNTTDFLGSVFGSWGLGPFRLNSDVGIGILEAPTEAFVQNDVVVYAAELLYRPEGHPLALSLSARGRASTRGRIPLGTEDRGRLRLLGELRLGPWRLDAGVLAGYAGTSPDAGLEVGAARVLDP